MEKLTLDSDITRAQQSLLADWSRRTLNTEWKAGDFLGSDLALSKQFRVSRTVVRGALEFLSRHGVVSRQPRRGMFLEKSFFLTASPNFNGEVAMEIFFIRWVEDTFTLEIAAGVLEEARRSHCTVKQGLAHHSESAMVELLDSLPGAGENVIMVPLETPPVIAACRRAVARGVRLVQADRYLEDLAAPSVLFDNYAGGLEATRHLLSRHPGPVFYFGCRNPLSARKRYQGWADSMRDAGYLQLEQYVIPCPDDSRVEVMEPERFFADSRTLLTEFLIRHPATPLSIFAMNDAWARQIYEVAATLDREIGRDIWLVGFDNLGLCERLTPTLSSIAVPRGNLGMEAVKMFVEHPHRMVNYCKLLPVELKIRQSS